MILEIRIQTTQKDLKRCISAAHEIRFDEPLPVDRIADFAGGDGLANSDLENIFAGSSFSSLIEHNNTSVIIKNCE